MLICLYGPQLLHVDLKFVVLSDLEHLVERPRILWARGEFAISSAVDTATIARPSRSAGWFDERPKAITPGMPGLLMPLLAAR